MAFPIELRSVLSRRSPTVDVPGTAGAGRVILSGDARSSRRISLLRASVCALRAIWIFRRHGSEGADAFIQSILGTSSSGVTDPDLLVVAARRDAAKVRATLRLLTGAWACFPEASRTSSPSCSTALITFIKRGPRFSWERMPPPTA